MSHFGVSPTRPRRLAFAAALVLLLAGAPSAAEIYKWVDAQGRVHFSDKPLGKGAVNLDPEPVAETRTGPAPEPVLRGIAYKGEEPSRLLYLQSVRVLFEDVPPGHPKVIGTVGAGSSCGSKRDVKLRNNVKLDDEASLQWHFHDQLAELGYRSPKAFKTEFELEGELAPDLSVIAVITGIKVDECVITRRPKQERNSTELTVEWQVRDNLQRRLVYEKTTRGAWHDSAFHEVVGEEPDSVVRAFLEATGSLFSDPEFVALLEPRGSASAAVGSEDDGERLSVPVVEGDCAKRGPSFRQRFATLRDGTATIRTAGGHGSGFLVSNEGYVLTNEHVVGKARAVVVVMGGKEYEAAVVARNSERDVALLQIAGAEVQALPICRADAQIGENVYIIGTPLDEKLALSVTKGIISQHREVENLRYYQTDASINRGNSGGPAFNERGEVIGIAVAATFAEGGGGMGIGYLIPIDDALRPLLTTPSTNAAASAE